MSFEMYHPSDGLSQNEFRKFMILWKDWKEARYANEELYHDLVFMVDCLERMIEAKDVQIAELNQELYELSFKKHK